ncbi:MAG: GreA/GreB family elongation factor [Candidatus Sumerlaeota bacterium]|nr:GreA/GreB family elongation factor [Candidatus Sumerlaeota bacterium]
METMEVTVFFDLTKRNKWNELEEAWLKYIENPSVDAEFYKKLISGMNKREAQERCDQMIALLIQNLTDEGRESDALRIARHCVPYLQNPKASRAALIATLEKKYGDRAMFAAFMEASGLSGQAPMASAFSKFMAFINFDAGESFAHKTWGVGTVTTIDPVEKKLNLRFPPSRRLPQPPDAEFTLAGAREYLRRLPHGHFLARLSREPEAMSKLANEKPTDFVKMAMKSLGSQLRVAELKGEMVTYLMSDPEWRDWWSRSRETIRVDPYIALRGSGLNATLSLREQPVSIYEQSFEALQEAETTRQRMEAARSCVRAQHKTPIKPEELAQMEQWVLAQFQAAGDDARRIEMHFLLQILKRIPADAHVAAPEPSLETIVRGSGDLLATILPLNAFEYQAPIFDMIREVREDWREIYETILPDLTLRLVERGVKALLESQMSDSLRHVSEGLLSDARRNIEAHLWAITQYLHGHWAAFAPALQPAMMMEQLLEHFERLNNQYNPRDESAPQLRGDINAIRAFLEDDRHAHIRKAVSMMSEEEAHRFYERLASHPGLDSTERAHIAAALRAERPELEVKIEENLLTSIYHYVTRQSYEDRQVELQRLRTVDIPANSERIKHARAMGDLSENAEYDAAKEEQARLMNRVHEMEDLIRHARIFEPADIQTDTGGPGSRIWIRFEDGKNERFDLLGIWDAKPEQGILSYRSPLGSQFLKHKVGDRLELSLPSGESRICWIDKIENALLEAKTE